MARHRTRGGGEDEKTERILREGRQNEVIRQVKGGSRRGQGSSLSLEQEVQGTYVTNSPTFLDQ